MNVVLCKVSNQCSMPIILTPTQVTSLASKGVEIYRYRHLRRKVLFPISQFEGLLERWIATAVLDNDVGLNSTILDDVSLHI